MCYTEKAEQGKQHPGTKTTVKTANDNRKKQCKAKQSPTRYTLGKDTTILQLHICKPPPLLLPSIRSSPTFPLLHPFPLRPFRWRQWPTNGIARDPPHFGRGASAAVPSLFGGVL